MQATASAPPITAPNVRKLVVITVDGMLWASQFPPMGVCRVRRESHYGADPEPITHLGYGKSVAEFDEALEDYFVETDAFRQLIRDKIDIVAGDKGTGKTAIYRILQTRYTSMDGLNSIEVIPAFNPKGASIFEPLTKHPKQVEGEYNKLWKTYFLSLAGNYILSVWDGDNTGKMKELDFLLSGLDLRNKVIEAPSIFQKVLARLGGLLRWKSAQIEYKVSPDGTQSFIPRVDFDKTGDLSSNQPAEVPIEHCLQLLNEALREAGITIWIAIDRLDEAFHGFPEVEIPALRALFRSYLDLNDLTNLKLKLFVRRDLFRRITAGGFVNLTHVNARKFEIIWDDADLLNLICRRIVSNDEFAKQAQLESSSNETIFDFMFPEQVDVGKRKPKTWNWILRRIRDGNDVKPPRNLIDLISKAQQAQLRAEDRRLREVGPGTPLIEADALRKGLTQLSVERVNDTILSESAFLAPVVERFRGGKAEHNDDSLKEMLNLPEEKFKSTITSLIEIGFLEDIRGTYKVPAIYREGFEITQGKAFDGSVVTDEDDDSV